MTVERNPTISDWPVAAKDGGRGCRLVIIEDNALARETLQELLEFEGYTVASEEDGARGMALILRLRPDFALVDLNLPGLDGFAIARGVRAAAGGDSICLIAISGHGDEVSQAQSRAAGFAAHLTKPLDLDRLIALLQARA